MKPSYDIYEEMAKDGKGNDRLVRSILNTTKSSRSSARHANSGLPPTLKLVS